MTRNNSGAMTKMMQEQFDVLRRNEQRALGEQVLRIVGVHTDADGRRYVTAADLRKHDAELRELLGHVRAFWTSREYQRLYKNNVHVGMSLAKLVLGSTGCALAPLDLGGGALTV